MISPDIVPTKSDFACNILQDHGSYCFKILQEFFLGAIVSFHLLPLPLLTLSHAHMHMISLSLSLPPSLASCTSERKVCAHHNGLVRSGLLERSMKCHRHRPLSYWACSVCGHMTCSSSSLRKMLVLKH